MAAFASWHEDHSRATSAIADRPDLPAPVALETYSVLTRLPPPHRADAGIVRDFLAQAFPHPWLLLPTNRWVGLIDDLVSRGMTGGGAYDAVIALTATHHGRQLLTLDRRARRTYDLMGATARYLG